MAKKVFDPDSLYDRNAVRINGTLYELRTNEEQPPATLHRLGRLGARIQTITYKPDASADEQQELSALPREICGLVLDAPADVLDALTDKQRWDVCQAFLFQRNPSLIGMRTTEPATAASATGAS